jgi:hypothetical protein
MRGGGHFIWGRDRLNDQVREERPYHPEAKMVLLTDRFLRFTDADAQHATLYAMWSPVGATYARTYGIQSFEQSAALRDAFGASPFWSTELQSDGTYLFRFEPTRYQGEQP